MYWQRCANGNTGLQAECNGGAAPIQTKPAAIRLGRESDEAMSSGLVICSTCKREIHQKRELGSMVWRHCDDGSERCDGAWSEYPASRAEIVGKYCGRDGGVRR